MNSPFANLFEALQTRIKAQVPAIRWIDQDMGQLEHYAERPAVAWPCVLIDFDGWNFENMGQNCQTAEGDLIIRLAFPPFSHSNNLSPVKDKALIFYEHEFNLHKALQGWEPVISPPPGGAGGGFSPMTRISADTEKRDDPIRVRVIRYRLAFEDYSTAPVTTPEARPTPKFNI